MQRGTWHKASAVKPCTQHRCPLTSKISTCATAPTTPSVAAPSGIYSNADGCCSTASARAAEVSNTVHDELICMCHCQHTPTSKHASALPDGSVFRRALWTASPARTAAASAAHCRPRPASAAARLTAAAAAAACTIHGWLGCAAAAVDSACTRAAPSTAASASGPSAPAAWSAAVCAATLTACAAAAACLQRQTSGRVSMLDSRLQHSVQLGPAFCPGL